MSKKISVLLLFLLCSYESSGLLETIWTLGEKTLTLSTQFRTMKSSISSSEDLRSFYHQESEWLKDVLIEINKLSPQFSRIEDSMRNELGHIISLDIVENEATYHSYTKTIDDVYKDFKDHLQANATLQTWRAFARTAIAKIETSIKYLRALLIPVPPFSLSHERFILKVAKEMRDRGVEACEYPQTYHFLVSQLIDLTMFVELKALTILAPLYPIVDDISESSRLIAKAEEDLESRYLLYLNIGLQAMDITSSSFRRCDPKPGGWARGESYIEMEKLQQTVLPPRLPNSGIIQCSDYTADRLKSLRREYSNMLEECDGGHMNCWNNVQTFSCALTNDVRRYSWYVYDKADVGYGWQKGQPPYTCNRELQDSFCLCECRKDNVNWVSSIMATSNIDEDMVVIGVRLRRINNVMYIEVKQGKFLPNFQIDPTRQSWVPIREAAAHERIPVTTSKKRFFMDNGQKLEYGKVLTGVQFQFNEELGIHIRIQGHPVEYLVGRVMNGAVQPELRHNGRPNTLEFKNMNSIYTNATNKPDFDLGVIDLQQSELRQDVGQSMLPLFDSQPVEPNPPSPLSGVGLFHKGSFEFAGFIGLQVHALPYKDRLIELIERHEKGRLFYLGYYRVTVERKPEPTLQPIPMPYIDHHETPRSQSWYIGDSDELKI